MSATAILLVLLSAVVHVGWNLLTKSSRDPVAFSCLKGAWLLLLNGSILVLLPVASIPAHLWLYIVVSGLIHAMYVFALSSAYETGDISLVYPIARSAPAFVPLAAYLLIGEVVSWRGAVGIAVVVACIFLLQVRGDARIHVRQVFQSFRSRECVWALATLASVVAYTLVDKAGMVAMAEQTSFPARYGAVAYFCLESTLANGLFGAWVLVRRRHTVRPVWEQEGVRCLLAASSALVSYSLILFVMQTEPVSYIVTLRQSSVLIAVLVGCFVFKEPYGRLRAAAAAAMIYGLYLVTTA